MPGYVLGNAELSLLNNTHVYFGAAKVLSDG